MQLKYNFEVFDLRTIFIYLVGDSDHLAFISYSFLMCYQSDTGDGRILCERTPT